MANKNRDKGHRYERMWANVFKDLGWEKCITARQGSRIADDSGIDLINIPYNMQLKCGYPRGINYKDIFDKIDAAKEANFLEDDPIQEYPTVIAHKKTSKINEHFVIMKADDWIQLIQRVENIKQQGTSVTDSDLYKDLVKTMQKYGGITIPIILSNNASIDFTNYFNKNKVEGDSTMEDYSTL